jgi:hypothetical protein
VGVLTFRLLNCLRQVGLHAQNPQPLSVTSNLAPTIQISHHGRGRDGLLQSKSPRSKFFVICILTSKLFAI